MAKRGDFVLLRDTTLSGASKRIKEYGVKGAIKKDLGVDIGVICSFNGTKLVVVFSDEIELYRWDEVYGDIVKIYRNRAYNSDYVAMELEESTMSLYGSNSEYRRIRDNSKGTPSAIFSYILTCPHIVYPTGYARLDFNMEELFSEKNGFYEVENE